jgi:PAS domain S-box-containing protein
VVVGSALLGNDSERAIAFVLDLTRLKQVEEALQESEAQLQAILDNATILIYVKDLEGRYLLVNRQFEEVFKISKEDFIGKTDYDFFPKKIADAFRANDKLVLTGNAIEIEEIAPQEDELHTYISVKFPLYDTTGKIYASCGISTDINERKLTEKALREREQRFSTLFNAMNDWVLVYRVTPEGQLGKIIEVNEQACQKLGYSREELLKMSVAEIVKSSASELQIILEKLVNEKRVVMESVHATKDGRYIPVEVSATLFTLNGLPTIQSICRDITERKQAEQERERLLERERTAREEAETANRIKDEFLAVLSHELRSPLNPILGWSRLLRTRKFEEDVVDRALETIERNAKLQTQLIEDLLDVSRILRGKLALNICPVNLSEVIEGALETVRLAAETKNIHIQTQLDSEVKLIKGDPSRLQQIVWNLLSNAIKFTPQGGRVEVRLESYEFSVLSSELEENSSLQNSQNFAQITVTDTGKGISPQFLPHVFEYFRQADGTTTRTFGGLGLGLAIARHLTELHGGTVWAQSQGEGQGATFTVRFPAMVSVAKTFPSDRSSTTMFDLSGLRVLLVDDEADMCDLAVAILKEYGAEVRVTGSATEALLVLDQFKPNVLISDIGMPEVDGYTLMRQIREKLAQQGEQIRAIALTAYAGEVDRQQALSAGFEIHLAKPIEPEQLVKAIASFFPSNQL